jgi:ABC-type glycerol-3-phosphate transport system substrate-binding protein
VKGKIYGVPNDVGPVVLWYNKELCQKARVDPTKIKRWNDFVDAVKKCQAAGTFHDGKTAFHLMGSWDLVEGRANSVDKKGLSDDKVGWIFFPEVEGGKGKANDFFLRAWTAGWLREMRRPRKRSIS